MMKRVEVTALVATIVAGTAVGSAGLARHFRASSAPTRSAAKDIGDRIAFVSDRDGNDEIYTMGPDGSDVRRLTNDPAKDVQPAWSPDGSQIAFISDRGGGTHIWIMASDGSHPHPVPGTEGALAQSQIAWSPGQGIAYAGPAIPTHSPRPASCVSNPCTGLGMDILLAYPIAYPNQDRVSDLIPIPGDQLDPAWDADGIIVSFVQETDAATCVLEFNLHSIVLQPDAVQRLAATSCGLRNSTLPASSPVDSSRLAFVAGASIYVSGHDGMHRLARGSDPSWSPDGSRLAFVAPREGEDQISIVGADGSGQHSVTSSRDGSNRQPAWSPPTRSQIPASPSMATGPSPSPTPSFSPSPSPLHACSIHETNVYGDFDGDGMKDVAVVGPTECLIPDNQPGSWYTTPYAIDVVWDSGAEGIWPLAACDRACAAFAAADLNGDGKDEFLLDVDEGASTAFIQVHELPPRERGPVAFDVAPPGSAEFPAGKPLRLTLFGRVRYQDFVTCRSPDEVIATSDGLSDNWATWTVRETTFTFDGSSFAITSANDTHVPADPKAPVPPTPPGHSCWKSANRV
jgi:WD40 repeat protein